jgi:hypothetical protein
MPKSRRLNPVQQMSTQDLLHRQSEINVEIHELSVEGLAIARILGVTLPTRIERERIRREGERFKYQAKMHTPKTVAKLQEWLKEHPDACIEEADNALWEIISREESKPDWWGQ